MGPKVDSRSKQEMNASLSPLCILYPLPFILYHFTPIYCPPVQSVYTHDIPQSPLSHTTSHIHRGIKWLGHSWGEAVVWSQRPDRSEGGLGRCSPHARSPSTRIQAYLAPFASSIHCDRLDGLGGGGCGGRGEGGRSRDWHTADAGDDVHDAIVVRALRKLEL